MPRRLTDRERELRAARAELQEARRALKPFQARLAAATRAVEALSRCDACGAKVWPAGLEPQLCISCQAEALQARRRAAREALGPNHYAAWLREGGRRRGGGSGGNSSGQMTSAAN